MQPHGLPPTRLLHLWDFPGKSTGVGCHCLLHDQLRQHIKKQRHYFGNKRPCSQGYDFSSSHVWMWELDYKESWAAKNWRFWTVVLVKALERWDPLGCKEMQPVYPKGNQSECSLEGPMLKLKLQCFGHVMWRADSLQRPWCWERLKVGEGHNRGWDLWWHHRLNGHEFE